MGLLDTQHVVQLLVRPAQEGRALWSWSVWQSLSGALSRWVRAPEHVEVRSHQMHRDRPDAVWFPTLGWSEQSAQIWTHQSPTTRESSEGWLFRSTHVMCPAWSQCVETETSPSLYVELKSRTLGKLPVEMLLVSIASELGAEEDILQAMRAPLFALEGDARALLVHTMRPFVHRQRTSLVRAIDEITHSEIDRELSLESLHRGSLAMDRRCRVVSAPWRPL